MPRPLENLIVHRKNVEQTPATEIRNLLTIQAALVRGDKHVTLHNASRVTELDVQRLRPPYHPRHHRHHDRPFECLFGYPPQSSSPNGDTTQPKRVEEYIEMLNWDGFRLEWVKVLGEGGFGMATLWNAIFEDGSSVKAVIKIPVRSNANFDSELQWHLRYAGASHVTQALDLQAMADNVRRRMNRGYMINRGARFNPSDLEILVLEYADRGSMFDLLNKASHFNIVFSTKALWEIWECLVKGAVSVALQPDAIRRWGHDGLDKVLESLDDPDNMDELRRICTLIDSHDVHFDIEEQNVLIAEDEQHGHHPIFKLHDFGEFSHKMRVNWAFWPESEYWRLRRVPKVNRIPPETITREWDTFDPANPGPLQRFVGDTFGPDKNVSAGRYGTWTNLFLIGQIMESVITKLWVSHPMTTMRFRPYDGRSDGQTYGWRICRREFAWIEIELRSLILQCQYEKPADRPPLAYLLQKIAERKQRGFPEEPDWQTRRFWDLFWGMQRQSQYPEDNNNNNNTQNVTEYENDGFVTAVQALQQDAAPPVPAPQDLVTNPYAATDYEETGNPLIAHVAALRLKSRRSPLMSSTEAGPSARPAHQHPYPPSGGDSSAGVPDMRMSDLASTAPLLRRPAAQASSSEEFPMRPGAARAQLQMPFAEGPAGQGYPMRPSGPMFGRPAAEDSSGEEFPMRPADATTVQLVRPPFAETSPIPDFFMRPTAEGLPLRRPPPTLGPSGEEFPIRPGAAIALARPPPAAEGSSGEEFPMRATATVAQARPPAGEGSSSEEFPMRATAVQLGSPPVVEGSSSEEFPMRATATVAQAIPPIREVSSGEEFPMRPTATVVQVRPLAGEGSSSEEFPIGPGATTTVPVGSPLVVERASAGEEFPIWATGDLLQQPPVAEGSSRPEFPMRPGTTAAATKKRSAEEADAEAESTTSSAQRKRQRRVRFDAASASSTVTMGMQPVHLVETAADESPGTLRRQWPAVVNTPAPNPTIAVTGAQGTHDDHMRSLHNPHDPGSTVSLLVPETDSRGRVKTGSKKDSKRKKLAKFFRLDRLRNKFRRTHSPRAAGAVQVESTPELGQMSRMDVDEEEERGEAMDEGDGDAVMGEASVVRERGDVPRNERVWWGDEPRRGGNAGNAVTGERIWW
ncbi:hypothetical protein TgHK011_009713 [Trichoderma gracile]|nr:hypothetical protein TgHK011_009713 [Trichoderma gracile]